MMSLPTSLIDHALTMTTAASATPPGGLGGLAGWTVDVITSLGPVGVGLLVAAENLFPPIPSEVILPVAGYAAGAGRMSVWAAWVAATLGSVLGAVALYWVGALLGVQRLRAVAERLPLLQASDVDKGVEWFDRYGPVSVLLGRCVPLIRSAVSVPAGVTRMPMRVFLPYTLIGSAAWNAVFVGAGYQLGTRWQQVQHYSGPLNTVVLGILAALVLWWIAVRVAHRLSRSGSEPSRRGAPR